MFGETRRAGKMAGKLVVAPAASALREAAQVTPHVSPAFHNRADLARRAARAQHRQQPGAGNSRPFRDDLDPAVRQVTRTAHQTELQRPGPCPPAKSHALDLAVHPRCQPHLVGVRICHPLIVPKIPVRQLLSLKVYAIR